MFYNGAKILVLRALSGLNYILADFSNAATQQGGVAASDGRAPRLACGLLKSPVDGIVSVCQALKQTLESIAETATPRLSLAVFFNCFWILGNCSREGARAGTTLVLLMLLSFHGVAE